MTTADARLTDSLRRRAVKARALRQAAIADVLDARADRLETSAQLVTCQFCARQFTSYAALVARVSHGCTSPVTTSSRSVEPVSVPRGTRAHLTGLLAAAALTSETSGRSREGAGLLTALGRQIRLLTN